MGEGSFEVGLHRFLEVADGILGNYQLHGLAKGVIYKGDALAKTVDLRDVGGVDDMAAPDALEVDIGKGACQLLEVAEAGKEHLFPSAFES